MGFIIYLLKCEIVEHLKHFTLLVWKNIKSNQDNGNVIFSAHSLAGESGDGNIKIFFITCGLFIF